MRQIIKDIIGFVMTGQHAPTLQPACAKWGERDVRVFCINLSSWWARRALMQSRHPYLAMAPACPWHPQFRTFADSILALRELIRFEDDACHFSDSVSVEERRAINDYAQRHNRPRLFTREASDRVTP